MAARNVVHRLGPVSPEGQACSECGLMLLTPDRLRYGGYREGHMAKIPPDPRAPLRVSPLISGKRCR